MNRDRQRFQKAQSRSQVDVCPESGAQGLRAFIATGSAPSATFLVRWDGAPNSSPGLVFHPELCCGPRDNAVSICGSTALNAASASETSKPPHAMTIRVPQRVGTGRSPVELGSAVEGLRSASVERSELT